MPINGIQNIAHNIAILAVMIAGAGAFAYGVTVSCTDPGKKRSLVAQVTFGLCLLITILTWNRFVLNK